MQTGTYISGLGHGGVIAWLLVGGLFGDPPPEVEVTEVAVISAQEFAALYPPAPEMPAEVPEPVAAPVAEAPDADAGGVPEPRTAAAPEPVVAATSVGPAAVEPQGRLLSFVTGLTAVAAAVLFVLALAIRGQDLPDHSRLSADDTPTFQEVLEDLEHLNEATETELEDAEGAAVDGAEGSGASR